MKTGENHFPMLQRIRFKYNNKKKKRYENKISSNFKNRI